MEQTYPVVPDADSNTADSTSIGCGLDSGGRPSTAKACATSIRRLLVPTDFSSAANKAVERAVALAHQCNASVTLFHVIDINARAACRAEDLMKNLWDEGSVRMGQLAWSLSGRVEAQSLLEEGLPWERIVDKSEGFDLLILGRNRAGKRKFFSRHTGQRVLESAACPVMVVHEPD